MSEKNAQTPLEAMERQKARLQEELAALDRDMAKLSELEQLAAKYGYVVQRADQGGAPHAGGAQSQDDTASLGLTVEGLITHYQTDPRSKFQGLRVQPRQNTESHHRRINKALGSIPLSQIKGPDLERQYEEWAQDVAARRGGDGQAMAHGLIQALRALFNFGATVLEDSECVRLHVVLRNLRFQKVKPREVKPLTPEHIDAIIRMSHEMGMHTIGLAMAFQVDCGLRQRDVIGEWVPMDEKNFPFTTIVDTDPSKWWSRDGGRKWGRGLRWNEISNDRILRHTTSWEGKIVEIDLKKHDRLKAELDDFLKRRQLSEIPRDGAVIINEETGLPYGAAAFRAKWRRIADAAGVPPECKNMDSREPPERMEAAE